MEKFRTLYAEFCSLSIAFLERESGTKADAVDVDTDVDTLLTLVPLLEKRVCPASATMSDEHLLLFMKHLNYKALSFWFLRSDAVVKSTYNKIPTEPARARFRGLFREMLTSIQTIISLNTMYNHLKQDTSAIIDDSKKIMEIVAQMRATNSEQQAHQLLQQNYSFIVKTINKVLSDEFYLLKLASVFNSDLVNDRERLEEYRDLFHVSTENAVHGIRCMSEIAVGGVDAPSNRYYTFFRRVLSNVILFQTHNIHAGHFATVVAKLYVLIYRELRDNPRLAWLLDEVLKSIKDSVTQTELDKNSMKNLQSLVKHIAEHRTRYRAMLATGYAAHERSLVEILQEVVERNDVRFRGEVVSVAGVVQDVKTLLSDRLRKEWMEDAEADACGADHQSEK
uniref:Virion morphogenesis core protein n=1 Tax=Rousettus bat poxvirus TaxID=3141933 RepID=A0AAU7E243_9POXV